MSPNQKHVADHVSEADHIAADADPDADIARGRARPVTNPREKVEEVGAVVHDEEDPTEVDPGHPPRSPI